MKLGLSRRHLYRDDRRRAYLDEITLEAQVEALMDADRGDRTKLDTIQKKIAEIKTRHPKP